MSLSVALHHIRDCSLVIQYVSLNQNTSASANILAHEKIWRYKQPRDDCDVQGLICDVFLMLGYGRRQTCHLIGWPVPNSPYNLSTPVSFGLLRPESAKLLHGGGQPEERK